MVAVEYDYPVSVSVDLQSVAFGDPNLSAGESTRADRINLERTTGYGTDPVFIDGDTAIMDTGVASGHPDLNVVGGVDCMSGACVVVNTPVDPHGHGTHVAGIAAAKDDSQGITGVAAGARIAALAEAGISVGVGDGRYAPGQEVTRGHMAAFLRRSLAN